MKRIADDLVREICVRHAAEKGLVGSKTG